ncbi:MAG: flagellar biosynthesis protein FlhF, partial [Ketobacteraceae bacterium]|nr:flagellar biosynthesis protein FlhF [Ketobacteraceae bacterium]
EASSRQELRERFARERNKRFAMHQGLVENTQTSRSRYDYDPHQEAEPEQPAPRREVQETDAFTDPVQSLQDHVEARIDRNSSPEDISAMKQELDQLKNLLSTQLNNMSWGDYSYRHPLAAAVFKRLRKIGLSAPLCRSLLNQVDETLPKKEAWLKVLKDLSRRIPISQDPIIDDAGVVAFVGPAGVGKTTTIAKLAAEYALRHGPESLALVTTDSYRIAGHEQLRTLAQILKVPLRVVNEQNPLDAVLRSLSRKKMVFIDTAGLTSRDESFDHQMKLLEKSSIEMKTWLVLASTNQRRILEKTVKEYEHLKITGSILTKLDESASLGEALSVIIENRLAMAYVTNGQNIPDDIQRPKANQLINLAVSLSRDADYEESEIADMFAEVMVG